MLVIFAYICIVLAIASPHRMKWASSESMYFLMSPVNTNNLTLHHSLDYKVYKCIEITFYNIICCQLCLCVCCIIKLDDDDEGDGFISPIGRFECK